MRRLKTKPVALASVGAVASKVLIGQRFRRAKPKPRRMAKAAKIAIPGLLALGAGGTLIKLRKGGAARKARNFSLVGGAGPAPSNNQTRPGTSATPPATESSAKK